MQVLPQPVTDMPEAGRSPAANFAPPPAVHAPARPPNADAMPRSDGSIRRTEPGLRSTPSTGPSAVVRSAPARPPDGGLRIRIDPATGTAPLVVRYSAIVPEWMRTHATATWFENGVPVSSGLNGQTVLDDPGQHAIEVLVTARDGRDYRAATTVAVTKGQRPQ
jgi:hypothetical protein